MNEDYSYNIRRILEEGRKCQERGGVMGPTARCNKSSIYIFKW